MPVIGPLLSRATGATDWLGIAGVRGYKVRSDYNKAAAKIDDNAPDAKIQRTNLKEETRTKTPEPYRSAVEAGRPMPGERAKITDPTVNNPTKTNAEFNDAAGVAGVAGTGLLFVGMARSSYNIAHSKEPVKEAATEATGWGGAAYVGGEFATTGAESGNPYVALGSGLLGGIIGFTLGKSAGNATLKVMSQWKGSMNQYNEESRKEGCDICTLDHYLQNGVNMKSNLQYDDYIRRSILANNEFGISYVSDFIQVNPISLTRAEYPKIVEFVKKKDIESIKSLRPNVAHPFEFIEIMQFVDQNGMLYVATTYDSTDLSQVPQVIDIFKM